MKARVYLILGFWLFVAIPGNAAVKGVVLMTHGLNMSPARMEFLSGVLRNSGFEVHLLKLQGHGDGLDAFKRANRTIWLQQTKVLLETVHQRAQDLKVPTVLVGYSVGAVVAADLIVQDPRFSFDKQILFAPALTPRPRNNLVKVLGVLSKSFCVPSLAPKDYRSNDCTPVTAYDALFESTKNVKDTGVTALNRPTLVFIDRADELVSFQNMNEFIVNEGLNQWRVFEIHNKASTLPKSYHHLIIDQSSVGPAMWSHIQSQILEFLN